MITKFDILKAAGFIKEGIEYKADKAYPSGSPADKLVNVVKKEIVPLLDGLNIGINFQALGSAGAMSDRKTFHITISNDSGMRVGMSIGEFTKEGDIAGYQPQGKAFIKDSLGMHLTMWDKMGSAKKLRAVSKDPDGKKVIKALAKWIKDNKDSFK